jgi:excinuclease UvrABC nuclease subunit
MNYYKELLKLKDIHGQEVYLYSTIDINHNDIFGLANVVDEFKSSLSDYQKWALHFNKEDAKAMAEALLDRIKELEKTEQKQTLTGDEIIRDLEKRIESLELALRSLSSHPNKENNGRTWIFPTIKCKRD